VSEQSALSRRVPGNTGIAMVSTSSHIPKVQRRRSVHELRGMIGSITDELAADILCDWALVSASKALEQSRFEFAHDRD